MSHPGHCGTCSIVIIRLQNLINSYQTVNFMRVHKRVSDLIPYSHITHTDRLSFQLDVTPTPIPYFPDRHIVLETPQKYDDTSPDSSSNSSAAFSSPRPNLLENLKSDVAISFQKRISDSPISSTLLCRDLNTGLNKQSKDSCGTTTPTNNLATPTNSLATPTNSLATPTSRTVLESYNSRVPDLRTPTRSKNTAILAPVVRNCDISVAASTPYKQPHNHVVTSQLELRSHSSTEITSTDKSPKLVAEYSNSRDAMVSEISPREPLRTSQSLPTHSTPIEDSTSQDKTVPPMTLSPELNSPFNERAVDCPVLPFSRSSFNNSNGYLSNGSHVEGGGNLSPRKLSPHGFDVVRSLGRDATLNEMDGGQAVNPALFQPFRRRSRKSKEKDHRCNTQ